MSFTQKTKFFVLVIAAMGLVFAQSSAREVQAQGTTVSDRAPTYPAPQRSEFESGKIIVKIKETATRTDLKELNQRNGARTEEDLPLNDVSVVDLPSDLPVQEAVRRYENSPKIEYAEPDFKLFPAITPNDPQFGKLYGLNNTGQTGGTPDADIDAPQAWDTSTGSAATVVAVIDTGVDISHPDLKNNIWTNPGEIPGDGKDNDKNGYTDDVHGWDFLHNDNTVYDSADGDEHGTHASGTIAAEGNNGIGVTGVNWHAQIMPLKFLGPNGGDTSNAVKAIDYALKKGVKISNNSWGCGGNTCFNKTLSDEIKKADNAGLLFVAAAGNDGSNNDATPFYPASYDIPNVISVAATNDRDTLASFSNYGSTSVDIGAPGVNILSTLPGNTYGYFSGTSMATPHVTGVAALLKSQDPSLTDGEMKSRILQFAEPKDSLQGKTVTGGRLNAVAPLTQQAAPDTIKPSITSVRPLPGYNTRDRTPTIGATVSDDRTDLTKSNIHLYLDGKQRTTFSYDINTDRLSYTTSRLSYASHTVKIVVRDAAGNTAIKKWSFKVVR